MKHLFKYAIIALAIFSLNACKKAEKPEDAAKKFVTFLDAKEYDKAKELGTKETAAFIDMAASLSQNQETDKQPTVFDKFSSEIDGEKAIVKYTADGKEEELNLVKQDGKWLVHMSKEDTFGEDMHDMEEQPVEAEKVPAEEPQVK